MKDKPHLSPSSITQYMKCSAQYMFKKIIGPTPPTIALLYGKSIDEAINVDLEQKIETREDLPVDDLKDAFVTGWDEGKQLTLFHSNDKPEELREIGVKSIEHWHKDIANSVQPSHVQEKLFVEFEDFDYNILQFADVITEDRVIIDNKTAGRSITEKNGIISVPHDHRLQLTLYDIGFKVNYGKEPTELGLDYLIKNKTPKSQRTRWKPNKTDKNYALTLFKGVAKGIDNETYIPNRSHFMCSKRFCAYWRECESNFGGKVKE